MDIKKIFGIIFTLLGTVLLLFAAYAMLKGATFMDIEITEIKSLVPLILGFVFFGAGIKLFR